jgi:hypothetical protein
MEASGGQRRCQVTAVFWDLHPSVLLAVSSKRPSQHAGRAERALTVSVRDARFAFHKRARHEMLSPMKRYLFLGAVISYVAIVAACSSSSSGGGTTPTDAGQQKDGTTATNDSGGSTDDGSTGTDDGSTGTDSATSGGPTLTINNYLSWCAVTFNGGTPSTMGMQTIPLEAGTSVMLHGDTATDASFYWGYWGNTDMIGMPADGGMDLNKDLSFTLTNSVTLNACCPDNGQPLSQCTF